LIKIAIQGEPGSFSHAAAIKLATEMGETARIVPFSLSAEAFSALVRGDVDSAVIPIENSLAGSVSEHFDLMLSQDVTVVREVQLRIRHNLIAISGAQLNQIDRVFSHPVALAQCRRFLGEHPKMESFAFYDTAGSVKQLVELRVLRGADSCRWYRRQSGELHPILLPSTNCRGEGRSCFQQAKPGVYSRKSGWHFGGGAFGIGQRGNKSHED
jgi:Prephenate dehydratase